MKVIKIVGGLVALIVVVLLITVLMLPSTAHMERSVVIRAAPDEVYQELISYRNFNTWSPWAMKDSSTQYQYEGPEFGVGTKIIWKSKNQDIGNGYMQITDIEEGKRVSSIMSFDDYNGKPIASFVLETVSEGTLLTWSYDEYGVSGINKLFLLGIDGFLGADYEKGLQNIKKRIESAPDFNYPISMENIRSFTYLGIKDSSLNDASLISTKMAKTYGELMSFLGNKGIEMTGSPVTFYSSYNDEELSFTCGVPVQDSVNVEEPGIIKRQSHDGLVLKLRYTGGYSELEDAYEEIKKFATFYNYSLTGNPWEEYVTNPEIQPDTSRWITHIYYPIQ